MSAPNVPGRSRSSRRVGDSRSKTKHLTEGAMETQQSSNLLPIRSAVGRASASGASGDSALDVLLLRYNKLCHDLAECAAIDKTKDLRDQAEAVRAYAKQASNREAEVLFAEVKVRAERKVGELLIEMAEAGTRSSGRGNHKAESHRATPLLDDLGIDKHESSRYQQIAGIPEEMFESMLEEARKSKRPITSASMLKLTRQPTPRAPVGWHTKLQAVLDAAREGERPVTSESVRALIHQPTPPPAATSPPATPPAPEEKSAGAAEQTASPFPAMPRLRADDLSDSDRTAEECRTVLERALGCRTRQRLAEILVVAGLDDLVDAELLQEVRLQVELHRLKSRKLSAYIAPPTPTLRLP